ncbi:hypothetical protein Tco_1473365 [Tanacetum coccineum]
MSMDDLLQAVLKLISRIDSLETDLKQTKLTMGNVIMKLVKKVKKCWKGFLKRRNMVLSDSKEKEPEAQGRKSQDDPLDSSVQGLVTPSSIKVNASGDEQVEDIIPNTHRNAAKTLLQKSTSSPDKGQRAGKAPMIIEETPKKSKEQVLQEEASLAEAIRDMKLSQLKNLSFEEVKKEFDKLVKQVESFALERITKKRTKNKAKTTKPDSEWKRL